MSVKDAVRRATEYFTELYAEQLFASQQFKNLMLEEVEREGDYWHVTLGYDLPSIATQFGGKAPRVFKLFKIDASTGEVVSMKIREVAPVE